MKLKDCRGVDPATVEIPRAELDVALAWSRVEPIVADVANRGAEAVLDAGEKFDGFRPDSLRVPDDVIAAALDSLDAATREALLVAIDRIRTVHQQQKPSEFETEVAAGGIIGQRWIPVDRVGLYVPGGRAVYPSSVMMNVVPAQVAGVASIAVASPPQPDTRWPHPVVLATCALLGIDELYATGGAQAIALFAYGADIAEGRCEPVSLVTGPGNIYVTAAKRMLRGRIGIDSEAGPTEILVVADDTADAGSVAADLISQAEHDVIAASVLVTPSAELADAVLAELETQVAATKHRERITEALSGDQSCIVLVDSVDDALTLANTYAAEHLEIHTAEAIRDAQSIRNAGAIFIGRYSPVSLGDYAAGSNHVLPTGGSATHDAGLHTGTFLKSVQTIHYSQQALHDIAAEVITLAEAEDLPAHAAAIKVRETE